MPNYSADMRYSPVTETWRAAGGDDVRFTESVSMNTTGSTVEVELRLTDSTAGDADEILTVGSGLTVTPGASSQIVYTVPGSFAANTTAPEVFATLVITTSGGVRRTWKKARIIYSWAASQ